MCKVVRDVQHVADPKEMVKLSAKGYEMFYAPVWNGTVFVQTMTLREEVDLKEYEKTVKETIKDLGK